MNEYKNCYFKKKSSERNYGFTLIELLVTLTIASILFGLGYANFRNFQRKQAVMGAARQLGGDVNQAKELAFSGSKPADQTCQTLVGYKVRVITAENAYQVNAVCINNGLTGDLAPKKKVTLPSNLVIGIGQSRGDNIIFKTLGQGTDIKANEPVQKAEFTVQLKNTAITASVIISKIGETTIQYK